MYTMSTSGSFTNSSYEPYALHCGEGCFEVTISDMNDSADDFEDDDAAATTICLTSSAPRGFGSIRRSLVKVRAMPPVAED